MLSPEVWNFKPPRHRFATFCGSKEANSEVTSEIVNHYFNHSVTLVLPDSVLVPEDLNTVLTNDSIYYKVLNLPVHRFLDRQFIESFIKSGQLTALSVGTNIDTDDCAAITPCGHLILNLLKETFQSLGLEGKQSKFSSERYVVQIDLKNITANAIHARMVKQLSEYLVLQMDFIIAWVPPEPGEDGRLVCPSSVAAYLDAQGYELCECTPSVDSSRRYCVRLPSLDSTDDAELLEWLGAVALDVDTRREDAQGYYLSSYRGPLDIVAETQVAILNYKGLFTTKQIENLFKIFSLYVSKRKDMNWAALHVQGFADSPVSWGLKEHTFYSDGDNNYTLVLKSDGSYKLFKIITAPTKMKLKVT